MISEVLVISETETFSGAEGGPTITKRKCWI